ncbi:hypothetical protein ERC79_19465 [Rhodococcus sp. ABRD24]|uniref:hypothetical protein n=1 Tax=Rhodococcus sp. ABRD24 TaxID=2507582 RepID=UPI00103C13CC|nr:hypothetical protein [Rhodococcus sp. ABRD24]QBJ97877.1 hypothetical protein ERC79_19465 [Rhodococcus sp. ABRD24]
MDEGMNSRPLDSDERAELLRLRAQVAALRGQEPDATGDVEPTPQHHWLRWTAVTLLLVLVALLAIVSVTSRFTRSQILDTDRYVSTVAPLAEDPAVQAEISNQVTDEVFTRIDVEALTTDALAALADVSNLDEKAPRVDQAVVGLAPVIAGQAKSFVHETVLSFVQSQQFQDLWILANRTAHDRLVALVTGNYGPSSVQVDQSGTVSISLSTIIDNVRTELTDRGFTFAENIPTVDKQFVLFQSPNLVKAQQAVNTLDKASAVLPWLGIACAAAAVAIAPAGRRLHTLSLAGLAIAVGMFVLAVAMLIARAVYIDDISPDVLSPDAARAAIDTVLVPLRTSLRAVAVVGLVIAIGAYLIGGSASAGVVRRGFGHALDFARHPREGRTPNRVERWAGQARVPLRCFVIGIAALLLVFWRYPTGLVVLWIVLGAVIALLALELLIRPTQQPQADHPADTARPTTS